VKGLACLAGFVLAGGLVAVPARAEDAGRVVRDRLPNGMTLIVRENPLAPVVAVALLVQVGGRWERRETAGISNFLSALIVKGTTKQSGAELAERIAGLGGKLSASGDVDYSEIHGTALARFWRELLGLTAELALEPKLAPGDVDIERQYLLARVQRRADNPASRAFDEFFRTIYDGHPYANAVLGTEESLKRIDHPALVAHYRTYYRPERMELAISGQVSAPEVLAEGRRLFGGVPGGVRATEPPIPPPARQGRRVVIEQPAQQAQILAGGVAARLDDPDHAAVKVLATALGGGMAGRLFAELRDKRGLAYTATSYYEALREPGALVLYLGTAPENAERAEAALSAEITRIKTEMLGAEELRRAQGYLLGRYAMDRRTNERQAWYLAFYANEQVPADFPERYQKAVEAVSAADVQRVARRYLDPVSVLVLRPPAAR
jgi:zinc protease